MPVHVTNPVNVGDPKGVMLSHRAVVAAVKTAKEYLKVREALNCYKPASF
jgi:long-subunit acyl-CoA synthetase (AMP-forming)